MPTASKGTCLTFETCATIDDEILSKVTSIEDEEDCEEDTDEIEDLIQPPTKYDVMQALEVLQTCTFYDADVGDDMRAKVNAFSKLYDNDQSQKTKGYN